MFVRLFGLCLVVAVLVVPGCGEPAPDAPGSSAGSVDTTGADLGWSEVSFGGKDGSQDAASAASDTSVDLLDTATAQMDALDGDTAIGSDTAQGSDAADGSDAALGSDVAVGSDVAAGMDVASGSDTAVGSDGAGNATDVAQTADAAAPKEDSEQSQPDTDMGGSDVALTSTDVAEPTGTDAQGGADSGDMESGSDAGEDTAPPQDDASPQDDSDDQELEPPEAEFPALCAPCLADADCQLLSPGARCLSQGAAGSFCGEPCKSNDDCPTLYECKWQAGLVSSSQCVLSSGTCSCSETAIAAGSMTACTASNSAGTCAGTRTCTATGLSDCNAQLPEPETCNGQDDNCDGKTDEGAALGCTIWFLDKDGDGLGSKAGDALCLCQPSGLYSAVSPTDCNDSDTTVQAASPEVCDGLDNDCNGSADTGLDLPGCTVFFADNDGDGFGGGSGMCLCAPFGANKVTKSGDCNDNDPSVNPDATEVCGNFKDDNCADGEAEPNAKNCTTFYADADGDGAGFGSGVCQCGSTPSFPLKTATDCDDTDKQVHPKATESCNGKDDDCDSQTDEANAIGCNALYVDVDGDGYGSKTVATKCLCGPSGDYKVTIAGGDCNDDDATVSPGATEVCNGKDDNCDLSTDPQDASDCSLFYLDIDKDGWGTANFSRCLCAPTGNYAVAVAGDCNDNKPLLNPDATEICNSLDDNCDGATDEGLNTEYYQDIDGDGWGVGTPQSLCGSKDFYTATKNGDCDEFNTAINPGGTEICNSKDDNCKDGVDEGLTGTYYADVDGDGWGSGEAKTQCGPSGFYSAITPGDCDDNKGGVNPLATESCNSLDDDCDGTADEGVQPLTYYKDGDGDGYGDAAQPAQACTPPAQYVSNSSDCNDASGSVYPTAPETECDGIDQDCAGGDVCTTPCVASLLKGFNGSGGYTESGTQWWIDSWLKTEGSNSLTFQYDPFECGYDPTVSAGETATFSVTVPAGAKFVALDVLIRNYGQYGADTTSYMTITMNGSSQVFGPYATIQNDTKVAKFAVTPAQWNKSLQVKVRMDVLSLSLECAGGFAVDNVRVVCE